MYTKYVDPEEYQEEKEESKEIEDKFGIDGPEVLAVDLNYAAVATEVTQKDKESEANLRKAHLENLKRFDYLKG